MNRPIPQTPPQQYPQQYSQQEWPPQNSNTSPAPQQPSGADRMGMELEQFRQDFPNLYALVRQDSRNIPEPVWERIAQGMTLSDAFRSWLDEQQAQNLRNSHRSAGSMRSAGRNTAVSDPFLRGFHAKD